MESDETPSEERIREDVQHLKEWMSKSANLPNIKDEDWLETFLRNCKFNLKKTKSKLECYYLLKNKHPRLLKNRNPTAPELQTARKAITLAISDRLTKDGCLIIYHKYEDPSIFNAADYFKRMIMVQDMILLEKNAPGGCALVTDFKNFRYRHFLKLMPRVTALTEIMVSCYAEKSKGANLINAPRIIVPLLNFVKKIAPAKLMNRVHATSKSDLRDVIDEEVLCSDFGGRGASLAELEERTQKLLEKHSEWFVEQDHLFSDPILPNKDDKQAEETEDSLQKLEVD